MTHDKTALRPISRSLLTALVLTSMLGCREEDRTEPRPEVVDHRVEPQQPVAPAPPTFSPCPVGFHQSFGALGAVAESCELDASPSEPSESSCALGWAWVDKGKVGRSPLEKSLMICQPPLPPARCPDGQRVDLESGGCVPVGSPCPGAGAWPTQLPAGSVLYVRAGAAGTGTQASPLGTLDAALTKAKPGDVIAVGAGTYKGAFVIHRKLSIIGTCPGQVILEGPVSTKIANDSDPTSIEGTLDVVSGGELTLRDVTVRGQRHGLHLHPTAQATVSGVRFDQNTDRAILVQGGTLGLSDAVVERTLPRLDGTKGRGLQVNAAGKADAVDVTFQDNDRGEAAAFTVGASLTIKDCLLQNTRSDGDGYGVIAAEGAQVHVTSSAVQRKRGRGVHVADGGMLTLLQSSVANIEADLSGSGWGGYVGKGSTLKGEDSVFHHALGFGIFAESEGTSLSLVRSTIAFVTTNPVERSLGRALNVQEGARAVLDTVRLATNSEAGLVAKGASVTARDLTLQSNEEIGALVESGGYLDIARLRSVADVGIGILARRGGRLVLRDARIEDPQESYGSEGATLGVALSIQDATATFERVSVRHSQGIGVALTDSMVDSTGLVIEDTLSLPGKPELGVALFMEGGVVSVDGLLVRRALMGGIFVGSEPMDPPSPDTTLTGSDVIIQEVSGQEKDGTNGVGLMLGEGAHATLARVSVSRAHSGAFVAQHGAEATLTDLTIEDTLVGGGNDATGYGMYIAAASHVTVDRASVRGSLAAGVLLNGNGGTLDATDLTIRGTAPVADEDGVGLRIVGGAAAKLRSSAVIESHAVGVMLQFAGALDAEDLTVRDVRIGALTSEDAFGSERIDSVGSCLLATARSTTTLSRTRLEGCPVLGALFDDSQGTLTDVQIDGSGIGLAIQGFPEPTVAWGEVGLTTNATPLNYRESDFPVPASPPPALTPSSPAASVVRAE